MKDRCMIHGHGKCDCYSPRKTPEAGSREWKDDQAFDYCANSDLRLFHGESKIIKLPKCDGHVLGYMAITINSAGANYFRVDDYLISESL